ncbi:deoxyribodipyrimidine photo-lyase-like [Sycon ciliatum]|uniref:deoxyribodipyrimidine photo-lyase-like n=1 Tax=Sycon ciliatum TaxID=27933 RepID=UPI0031F71343
MSKTQAGGVSVEGVQAERVRSLNEKDCVAGGHYVLYWMQASVRCDFNHALEFAIARANALNKPLACCFGLTDGYPEANERHYAFMLQGLAEVQSDLLRLRHINLDVFKGSPEAVVSELSNDACEVVTDMGYMRIQRSWRTRLAERALCNVWQIESDIVVPVETASDKEEFAARTIRGKIQSVASKYLKPVECVELEDMSIVDLQSRTAAPKLDLSDVDAALAGLDVDRSVPRVSSFIGGRSEAQRCLQQFIDTKLSKYGEGRDEPMDNSQSYLSAYLHFGQISPVEIILAVRAAKASKTGKDNFIEQLMIRRELAINFCWYCPQYDSLECLHDWAKTTLAAHRDDKRDYVYDLARLESGQTHDPYWNAIHLEMVVTGKMHGYFRMYWGKKVLEWTTDVDTAFKWLLYLNNKYELDGRDANGYTGVAWIFGKHDRAHAERAVYGKVRYMSQDGIKRKFKTLPAYVKHIEKLAADYKKTYGPIGAVKSGKAGPSATTTASSASSASEPPAKKKRK